MKPQTKLLNLMHDAFGRISLVRANTFRIANDKSLTEEERTKALQDIEKYNKELVRILDDYYEYQKPINLANEQSTKEKSGQEQ